MKKNVLLIFVLAIHMHSFSQDTIIKFNGDQIQAKIILITGAEIKYKKFDYQEGPLYIENKSEIKMIKYATGLKEEFAKINYQLPVTKDDYFGTSAFSQSSNKMIYGVVAIKHKAK
jgi:hypothetical protein